VVNKPVDHRGGGAAGLEHADEVPCDVALQAAVDLSWSLAFGGSLGGLGASRRIVLKSGEHDPVQDTRAGPRARNPQRLSCRPHSPARPPTPAAAAPRSSGTRAAARRSTPRTGGPFDPAVTREYFGGVSLATVFATVSRASPIRRAPSPLRAPLDQCQPPDLSPLPHAKQTLLLARSNIDRARV
jgi:hypothetical protein